MTNIEASIALLSELIETHEESVPLSRLCKIFGLDPKSQRRRVQSREQFFPYLSLKENENPNIQPTILLHKDAIPMWIATLEVNSIREDRREVILSFKEEAMSVLENLLEK